jgi:hypothetical protein
MDQGQRSQVERGANLAISECQDVQQLPCYHKNVLASKDEKRLVKENSDN